MLVLDRHLLLEAGEESLDVEGVHVDECHTHSQRVNQHLAKALS